MGKIGDWVEERLELKSGFSWFLNRKVPRGVGWWYTLGSATMVTFILLLFTGLFLMLNYSPSPDHAYESIQYIMNDVTFGSLVRGIHHWSASAIVVLIGLHGMRTFFMAAYKYPRELTWVVGSLLFILVLGASFILLAVAFDLKTSLRRFSLGANAVMGNAGALIYAGTAVLCALLGGLFLDYAALARVIPLDPVEWRSLGIFLVEVGVGLAVMSIMASLYWDLSSRGEMDEGL